MEVVGVVVSALEMAFIISCQRQLKTAQLSLRNPLFLSFFISNLIAAHSQIASFAFVCRHARLSSGRRGGRLPSLSSVYLSLILILFLLFRISVFASYQSAHSQAC